VWTPASVPTGGGEAIPICRGCPGEPVTRTRRDGWGLKYVCPRLGAGDNQTHRTDSAMDKLNFYSCAADLERTFGSEIGNNDRILIAIEAPTSKVKVATMMIDDAMKLIGKCQSKKIRIYATAGQTVSIRSVWDYISGAGGFKKGWAKGWFCQSRGRPRCSLW
jgi:hypothetical protein